MNLIFKIFSGIFITLVILFALFFISTLLPLPGNFEIKVVQSGSMEPTIHTGAVIVIKPVAQYVEGDVVTFGEDTRESVPTTHRIVASRVQDGVILYTTKGDANDSQDLREITENEIIGKVMLNIPYLGYILDFARKPIGFIILIGIPVALIIYDEIRKIIVEVKRVQKTQE